MKLGDEEKKICGSGDQVFKSLILLKNGEIVNDKEIYKGDVLIEGGKIKKIDQYIRTNDENVRVVNCEGKYIFPGGIDVSTNFLGKSKNITSTEDFITGSSAALWGGTTFYINATKPEDSSQSLLSEFNQMKETAKSQSCCDFSLSVAIKNFNDEIASQMKLLVNENGVNSFQVFLRDCDSNLHNDDVAYEFLRFCKNLGVLVIVHAENGKLTKKRADYLFEHGITGPEGHLYSNNDEIESASISRLIALSGETNCPLLFVNIMCSVISDVIAKAKNKSSLIYGETISASLAVNGLHYGEKCWSHAAAFISDPPLALDIYSAEHLMKDLSSGCIDVIGSNHCKFTNGQRKVGFKDFRRIPSGLPGVAERMMIVWDKGVNSGAMDVCKFVSVTSTTAARLFNIYPQKGAIKEGSDADIVIWDRNIIRRVYMENNDDSNEYNIYKDLHSQGAPSIVFVNGVIVSENAILNSKPGSGRFIKMNANNPFVYRHVALKDKILSQKLKAIYRNQNGIDNIEETKWENLHVQDNEKLLIDPELKKCHRPTTRCGGRNMQDSTFSLSGAQVDDNKPARPGIRSQQPPGGVSTNLW